MGSWLNYDELEDKLTLDELLLTSKAIQDRTKADIKIQAMCQGIDTSDWDDDLDTQYDQDELPEELFEAERALKEKQNNSNVNEFNSLSDADGFGFGHIRA